jgi:two-component system, OmpR family, sensor histidine kinase ChvG
MVRVNDRGEVIVSVAVPVQRFRAVRGALLLSTQGGDINQSVEAERLADRQGVPDPARRHGGAVDPARRHHRRPGAAARGGAERVRRRIRSRVEIPDFTGRRDEIGHLSGALRDMTNALYSRIEAIESFAADVAHELKNPLTSLRSAVETLPLAKTPDSRERLLRSSSTTCAARPADFRHLRRQPPRCRAAARQDPRRSIWQAAQHRRHGANERRQTTTARFR